MLLRAIPVTLFVLLAAATVVRTAAVGAFAEADTRKVAAVWPSHPDVLKSVAMRDVGEAAGAGATVPPQALRRLEQLASAEPLAAEPFLVHSAIAQRRGDIQRAERLLVQARELAPRSPAARFLLADLYFRTGRILPGLAEMSVLGRLIPGAMQQVAPSLAAYATSAGAAPHLRRILLVYPELEPPLLSELAEAPRNTELILAIARPATSGETPPAWQGKLLGKLVEQGEFARAHSVWARLSGVPRDSARGLFNPRFQPSMAPPPFKRPMILSHEHRFIFIKGKKVAGTSAEVALSQICGPDDIITPVTPADEAYRLGTAGEPRNYASRMYPAFLRSALERRYVRSVRSASPEQLGSVRHPRASFRNHMALSDVLRLVPGAADYQVTYVERSPYAKVMSLANWLAHESEYKKGKKLAQAPGGVAQAVDRLIESGRMPEVLNIDRYRDLNGQIRGTPWKTTTLERDLGEFMRSRGLQPVELVHAKRGFGSESVQPEDVLRADQIKVINGVFAEEFERFDWPMLG